MGRMDVKDLTTGSVAGKLYRFALPIIFTNLLQAIYNVVDMVIVGRFLGSPGMTAVTVGGQITMIVFAIISAYSNAESVLVGQLVGARNEKEIPKVVNSTLIFALIIGAILMVGIIGLSNPLLHGMNVPEEAFGGTRSYLIIYMAGTFFVYIYNVLYGLLRGIGESVAPMVFAIISTMVNVVLDILFVGVFPLGAGGAALATILSQALSMILMILFVSRKVTVFRFSRKEFRIVKARLGQLIKIGLPQMCQFVLTNISFVLISALINSYGVEASAAAGASNRIYNFVILIGQAMMAAIITLTAQNLPNKNYKRIRQGLGYGILLTTVIGVILWIFCQVFPAQLLGAFTTEQAVIDIGVPFVRILVFAFLLENIMFCFFGILTGAGYTHITMICALSSAFLVRFAFSYVLSLNTPLGFNGIALAYVLAPCLALSIAGLYTLSGRWKRPRIRT